MNRIEQLEKQVAVLRESVCEVAEYGVMPACHRAERALTEADRIAAEPVEATDWEVIRGACARYDICVGFADSENQHWFSDAESLAAWARAQGVGNG